MIWTVAGLEVGVLILGIAMKKLERRPLGQVSGEGTGAEAFRWRMARGGMVEVLRQARAFLARPGNDFVWSQWADAEAALREIDGLIVQVEFGPLPDRTRLSILFAPTGSIQEVSLEQRVGLGIPRTGETLRRGRGPALFLRFRRFASLRPNDSNTIDDAMGRRGSDRWFDLSYRGVATLASIFQR